MAGNVFDLESLLHVIKQAKNINLNGFFLFRNSSTKGINEFYSQHCSKKVFGKSVK